MGDIRERVLEPIYSLALSTPPNPVASRSMHWPDVNMACPRLSATAYRVQWYKVVPQSLRPGMVAGDGAIGGFNVLRKVKSGLEGSGRHPKIALSPLQTCRSMEDRP